MKRTIFCINLILCMFLTWAVFAETEARAAAIPDNAMAYNGHYYVVYDIGLPWVEAEAYCENLGGHLATIASENENSIISDYINGTGNKNCYWIGGYKESNMWKWIGGASFEYANWASGEPNNSQYIENYLMMFGNDYLKYGAYTGEWNDIDGDGDTTGAAFYTLSNFGFVCEWDSPESSVSNRTITYDVSNDMVNGQNPSGTWSYGWKSYPEDVFHLYDAYKMDSIINLPIWSSGSIINQWNIPLAWKNTGSNDNAGAKPGQVSIHPGVDGKLSVVRWTSPEAGTITVNGYFGSGDINQVSCYISKSNTKIFEMQNTYENAPFSFSQDVLPGDTIDFMVGLGNSDFYNCTTPLKASITLIASDTKAQGSYSGSTSYSGDTIKVTIDGVPQYYTQPPTLVNGSVMVPMRGIFEALGAEVKWDGATQTATATKGDKKISLTIGAPVAYVWSSAIPLDQPALIINGSTMVPVRFVSEALGCNVEWDALTKTVSIIRNDVTFISPTDTSDRSVSKDVNGAYDNYNVDILKISEFPHKEEAFASLTYETAKQGDEYLYMRRNVLVGPDGAPGDQTNDDFAVFDKPQWGLDSIGALTKASIRAAQENYASLYMDFFKFFAGDSELLNHYRVRVYHLTRYHLYDKAKTIYNLPGNSCYNDLLFDTSRNNSITYLGNVYVKENCSWIGIYDDRDSDQFLKVLSGKWIPVCQSSLYEYGFDWEDEPYIE